MNNKTSEKTEESLKFAHNFNYFCTIADRNKFNNNNDNQVVWWNKPKKNNPTRQKVGELNQKSEMFCLNLALSSYLRGEAVVLLSFNAYFFFSLTCD